mmetsp:Transcript_7215/g.6323  ORF Transcript_7215/g.6323 Transcript_7215/m.6323 type:complete len:107 (-) Transcript_7215:259-579(-)
MLLVQFLEDLGGAWPQVLDLFSLHAQDVWLGSHHIVLKRGVVEVDRVYNLKALLRASQVPLVYSGLVFLEGLRELEVGRSLSLLHSRPLGSFQNIPLLGLRLFMTK